MLVRDLTGEIERCKELYGEDFLDWLVYTEQITEIDKQTKRTKIESSGQGWSIVKDSEDWEYFECAGFWTKFPDKKIFTINVNY